MNKSEIRKYILGIRDRLNKKDKELMDVELKKLLISKEYYKKANGVFIYIGFGSEIDTCSIINKCFKDNKRVFVPRTNITEKTMDAVEIHNLDNLEKNKYGIYEPSKELSSINNKEIDLVVLPGVAFDMNGGRIGYGGGYYDKYLEKISNEVFKVALAYKFQIVANIPVEAHDILANEVITNK